MLIISDIKTKDVIKGTIKTINKSAVALEKTKDVIVNVKEKTENAYNSDSDVNEYTSQKVNQVSSRAINNGISKFNSKGRESVIETKNNVKKAKTKIKTIKSKLSEKRKVKKLKKNIKNTKKAIKTTKKVATETVKTADRARKVAIEATKKTIQAVKVTVKATISAIKAIIAGTKALISAIIAGGWVAVLIIVIILLIALILCSDFGIFFSSDNSNNITMDSVITDIDNELSNKINMIKNSNIYDEYKINYNPMSWKEILSIYTIKVSDEENTDTVTLNTDKISYLKDIYWNINTVTHQMNIEEGKNVLFINVSSKTLEETMNLYSFSNDQKERINILLSSDYNQMWNSLILGTYDTNFLCPVSSNFSITTLYSTEHQAIDVSSYFGDNIYSIYDGTVIISKSGCVIGDLSCNGKAGNYVVIKHNDVGYFSSYMHLDSVYVSVGDKINIGDIIGTMGNTGNVVPAPTDPYSKLGTHLHFVLYKGQ